MKLRNIGLLLFVAALLIIQGCKKSDEENTIDLISSKDLLSMENLEKQIETEISSELEFRSCPTVTWQNPRGIYPNEVVLDYGSGCSGFFGEGIKKGRIIIQLTDSILKMGAARTVSFERFSIDDVSISGTRVLRNEGFLPTPFFSIKANLNFYYPNGQSSTWQSSRNLLWTSGFLTPSLLDDEYKISGFATGLNRNGITYRASITEPLLKKANCFWFSSGLIELEQSSQKYVLNYGDGTCDNKIVVINNGHFKEISITRWW